jgi:hypothetical protein
MLEYQPSTGVAAEAMPQARQAAENSAILMTSLLIIIYKPIHVKALTGFCKTLAHFFY